MLKKVVFLKLTVRAYYFHEFIVMLVCYLLVKTKIMKCIVIYIMILNIRYACDVLMFYVLL
jgi:hypothetical protein